MGLSAEHIHRERSAIYNQVYKQWMLDKVNLSDYRQLQETLEKTKKNKIIFLVYAGKLLPVSYQRPIGASCVEVKLTAESASAMQLDENHSLIVSLVEVRLKRPQQAPQPKSNVGWKWSGADL